MERPGKLSRSVPRPYAADPESAGINAQFTAAFASAAAALVPCATVPLLLCFAVSVRLSVDDRELGEVGVGVVGDTEDQQGAVVAGVKALADVLIGGGHDLVGDIAGGIQRRHTGEHFGEA